ncbi:unnamed protein product [Lupinus luteus]|uniref:L-ascorbate oxidase n=1 Tax=Lupinus luteus TaxID=3873 RepID=A0AAV1WEN7_LUPLU
MRLKAVSIWCIWFGYLFVLSLGVVREYKFNVEEKAHKPDCVEHVVIGINGEFPGPTIQAEVGDILHIAVTNKLCKVGTAIHWHGIRQTPYLGSIKFNIKDAFDHKSPPDNYSSNYDIFKPPLNPSTNIGNGVYMFQMNRVVDLILQNANNLAEKKSEVHPWHMHGHDFWVLGYGEGKFQPGKDDRKLNLKNPPFRNNAVLFPHGWTALRFKADNPGVWAFHCHIEPHLHMGMGVVFAEAVQQVKNIPKEALACGLTGKMFRNSSKHN